MTLYTGHSSLVAMEKDRDVDGSRDGTECVTTQTRNAVGSTTKMESTIMLGVVHMAAKASTPIKSGTALVTLFSEAAESFGQEDLSCSVARTPAAISTLSIVSPSAAARRPTPTSIRHPTHTIFWKTIATVQLIGESTKRRIKRRMETAFVAMADCSDRC